ncbi:MAG: hypothetical protein CVV58_07370 [Tenericutes bacterium HGW-Tenericutes-3]|nr:MAG: hypothetical protein CVV58_07370 [Tenericutes bacterium HGW-Tenericutes-3]
MKDTYKVTMYKLLIIFGMIICSFTLIVAIGGGFDGIEQVGIIIAIIGSAFLIAGVIGNSLSPID